MGFYDDGPYEVGDESRMDPDLVPVPANSYLGRVYVCLLLYMWYFSGFIHTHFNILASSTLTVHCV